ncbi:outer membrane beta-barrel protein [Rhodocaloribacter litoris]|uniref:outer membrane beta-barrel protein n=1 Tax=Rhodocaloribacter litoris TaxID=2558931 RepID=UPI0014236FF8|nr:outer membrane beta-barrel protein [Rhodocaloribacter litoris]QXD14356.1 outer membrane beta-barrel protein [Rhodocaloribacter litoris]
MSGSEGTGRRRRYRRTALVLAVLIAVPVVRAQPVRQFEAGFERDVNRYRWTAALQVSQPVGAWTFDLTNRFASDAFILFEDRLSFRDENRLAWRASRAGTAMLEPRLEGRAAWFSLSRVFSQELYGGMRYRPRPYAWVEPVVGLALDQRPGALTEAGTPPPLRTDAGPAAGVRLALTPPPVDAYHLRLEGEGTWQFITPRRGRMLRLHGRAERTFEATRLTTEVRLASFRRDAYQANSFLNRNVPTDRLSETVEATTSDTLFAFVELETPIRGRLNLRSRLDVALNNRFVRTLRAPDDVLFFDSDFNRRAFDLDLGLTYDTPDLALRLGFQGGAEVERRDLANAGDLPPALAGPNRRLLRQADYDRGHVTLLARLRATLTPFLALHLDGTASALRHDTPEINPDDRDEILYNGTAGLLLQPSRYLQIDIQLFGSYFHTVYLRAERSAENNVQRSLRLRPSVRWTPAPRTQVRLTSEVRATYTVDDFVLAGRRPSDQSAREMRYELDVTQDFGRGLRVLARGGLSDLHLGRFLADRFAEIPFDTLRTYSGWLRLQAGQRITAEIGLRFFIRSDFDRATTVRYERVDENGQVLRDENGQILTTTITRPGRERIEQVGPTCALLWPMRGGSALRLDGWLTVQHVRRRLYGDLPEGAADRIRRAGRRGTRTLIPNLAVSVLWRF